MSESGEIQFVCIGCGTPNPVGAEVCAGCGHRFAGSDVLLPSPVPTRLPRPPDPFEPPVARVAPPRTLRIGSILLFIPVVAVCLVAFRSNTPLGIIAVVSLLPPTIRTILVTTRRRALGYPMVFHEVVATFLATLLATWGLVVSSLIAFCITCFPTGLLTQRLEVAVPIGLIAMVVWSVWLTSTFVRMARGSAARENEVRYR